MRGVYGVGARNARERVSKMAEVIDVTDARHGLHMHAVRGGAAGVISSCVFCA
jgi:hypothetical protein